MPGCVYMYHTWTWSPRWSEKAVIFPGTGVIQGCVLLRGCWELNPCLLQEQQLLLTITLKSIFARLYRVFDCSLGPNDRRVITNRPGQESQVEELHYSHGSESLTAM